MSYDFTDIGEGPVTTVTYTSGDDIEGQDLLPFSYSVSGTFDATLELRRTQNNGRTWEVVLTTTVPVAASIQGYGQYRWVCPVHDSGTATTNISTAHYVIERWRKIGGDTVATVTDEGIAWNYISNLSFGTLLGRCIDSDGNAQLVNVGNGLGLVHDSETDECTIALALGLNSFVRNTEVDTTFTIPDFITLMKYQATGGGASACKKTTLANNCSGGGGETQIGSLTVAAGDVIRVIIPAAVGASVTTDANNIAGGDVEIKVNGVTKVLAKGGPGGLGSTGGATVFSGGSGGTTPVGMSSWNGGVGRRDSSGTAFGAGVRGNGSGCGGNASSIDGSVTAAGCGFVIISY